MTVDDLIWIDSAGYHYADFPTFLQFYTEGYQAIYGSDVYLGSDSQDGQWVSFQAQAAYNLAAKGASVFNSLSPATAQGVGLARLVKINGIKKAVSTNSTVQLTIVGQAFTPINNGKASDTLNQIWNLPASVVIPSGGSIVVTATADQPGAIQAQASTITNILTPTRGWQTVNNTAAATPGVPVESDAALRARQAISVANPSLTVLQGTVGAVANTAGVTEVQPYENDTGTTDSNGIPPHMISLVVSGGADSDVASTIALHKTPGCGTYGTTTVLTQDAQGMPININFYRPTLATIGVKITLTPRSNWITTNETIISQAVADFINAIPIGGMDLGTGAGKGISFSELFAVAYVPGTSAAGSFIIESIQLSKNGGAFAAADVTIAFNEEATCSSTTNVSYVIL